MKSILNFLTRKLINKRIIYQLLAILAVVGLLVAMGTNYRQKMSDRGFGVGYDFLGQTAGFGISQTLIPYEESDTYFRTFLVGIVNTIVASILAIALASVIGFIVGIMRLSNNIVVSGTSRGFIDLLRNLPPLLHVLFWYQVIFLNILPPFQSPIKMFGSYISVRGISIPSVLYNTRAPIFFIILFACMFIFFWLRSFQIQSVKKGNFITIWYWQLLCVIISVLSAIIIKPGTIIYPEVGRYSFVNGINISPEIISLVVGLGLYTSTYIADIIRSSVIAVPKGQYEAAKSLGLSTRYELEFVILPQALRTMIPPTINQYLNIIKNTSLGVAIGYPDVVNVFAGTALNQSGRALEILVIIMMSYFLLSLIVSIVMNKYNSWLLSRGGVASR